MNIVWVEGLSSAPSGGKTDVHTGSVLLGCTSCGVHEQHDRKRHCEMTLRTVHIARITIPPNTNSCMLGTVLQS